MEKELLSSNPTMHGGDGPHSYTRNSSYQRSAIESAKEKMEDAISKNLNIRNIYHSLNVFRIVDFGCSVGPNTFDVVQNIIKIVRSKLEQVMKDQNYEELEFQIFFNNHSKNDFNTLFKTLPPSIREQYLAMGVPGSFYGKLFPRNSINIGHTSYTLHWLSKVPQDVCDKSSPAWNKDSILSTDLVQAVSKAYQLQFERDMKVFLEARAKEIVPKGLMIMSGMCLPDEVPMIRTWQGIAVHMIGDCLVDMAKSGITSEEKVQSFNLPVYFPRMSELTEVIERNGCFRIEVMEKVNHLMEDSALSNDFVVSTYRAILSGVIGEHFGDGIVDELFHRYANKLVKSSIDFKRYEKDMQYFILLKRIDTVD